ncbi:hypothetical protein RB623_26700 [Mesorhizobium sp. LHD-90]|uniref:hypothetical protein n=1 Tax=Mesorhizobium sp. LHD-90 TaxID=3071414 RepID=UPI0027DF7E10|nr:hypothetical protein [Mesorhizobium sp. LHD-90]MDQ6437656.1 hypothetical protein [Mesorhizobium sp. LHD-90]
MTRVLPPLHEGHAPIFLHYAFQDALDAYEEWGLYQDEPKVELEGRRIPISSVFGRMRTCTDMLPARTLDAVRDVLGQRASDLSTEAVYAEAAFLMRALCVERLRIEAMT